MFALSVLALASVPEEQGLPLEGQEAEHFLKTAEVVKMEPIGVGITRPDRVTLTDGTRTLRAVWKTIDEYHTGAFTLESRRFEAGFRDSYKYEIAAYELDKLLGLELIPPTVEREIKKKIGSLQLWVEEAFTESDRQERKLRPKDPWRYGSQMYKLYLLHQLTNNVDGANIGNILFDADFRVYAIDNSRSFRVHHDLLDEAVLTRFSRSVLAKMRELNRELLDEKLGRWLTNRQIEALLKRRERILTLVDELVAENGEAAVLYP
jgi:hypothetical protein